MTHTNLKDGPELLSTLAAGTHERKLALGTVLVSLFLFVAAVPFAKQPLTPVSAFIPIYESVLVINDLITAVLLFGQFRILGSRALLALACGYLFTALMTVVHAMSFPGLFAPTGLLGAGSQSTAWLYAFWHGGFPLFVIVYALLKGRSDGRTHPPDWKTIVSAVALVAVLVVVLTAIATAGHDWLPAVMQGDRYAMLGRPAMTVAWMLTLLALFTLWRRGARTLLDHWLMVVLFAWLLDIALSAVLNGGRFDFGFYAGRIYGLLASSFVLMVLLLESGSLFARLVETHRRERARSAELKHITEELEAANRRLEQSNHELEEASRLKSEFLASMSHELRTPLNAIIGFSELLKDGVAGDLSAQQQDFVTQVFDSGRHLLELINDILDLSKVEAGKMTVELDHVELNSLVQKCVAVFRDQAVKRDIRLAVVQRQGTEDWIVVDIRKFRQIIYNLLSNALKFAPDSGQIEIRLRAVGRDDVKLEAPAGMDARMLPLADDHAGEFLEIRISDNGIGISKEDLPVLFQTFRQIDSSLARQHSGTGLGLALVSGFAALHGGTVGVVSAAGKGAQFFVWLPWRTTKAMAKVLESA